MAKDKFNFEGKDIKAIKRKTIIEMTVHAEKFFKDSFDNQGFTDKTLIKWKESEAAKNDSKRRTLIDTGALRRSIKRRTSQNSGAISSDIKYAPYHNAGTDKHEQRQFMGESEVLLKALKKIVISNYNTIFK